MWNIDKDDGLPQGQALESMRIFSQMAKKMLADNPAGAGLLFEMIP
jgi:hypothetical protein